MRRGREGQTGRADIQKQNRTCWARDAVVLTKVSSRWDSRHRSCNKRQVVACAIDLSLDSVAAPVTSVINSADLRIRVDDGSVTPSDAALTVCENVA